MTTSGKFRVLLAWIFISFGCTSQTTEFMKKPIEIGDSIPTFKLRDQHGNFFNSVDWIGKEILVIFFYPKDDTPGCTKEACKFRDDFEDFTDLGARVIGISSDSVDSHLKFAEKYALPFTLLSDVSGAVRKSFGVPTNLLGLLPGRVTYIVDYDGVVVGKYNSQMNAERHVSEALQVISRLVAEKE